MNDHALRCRTHQGPVAEGNRSQVERNPVPVFQRSRQWSPCCRNNASWPPPAIWKCRSRAGNTFGQWSRGLRSCALARGARTLAEVRVAPFSDRCTAFSRWTAQPDAWRRPEAGAPSTRPGVRHKARRDPGPARKDPARVARGPVAILQRTSASALLTLISSKKMHARVHLRPRRFDGRGGRPQ